MPELPGKDLDAYDDDNVGTEMYYRAKNGEITIGRIGLDQSEKIKRIREGWTPLDAYGSFKIQPYHVDHPFEVLFQRGGAKEMTLKQIVDQGFYFRPPLVPRCGVTQGERGHLGNRKSTKHTPTCVAGAEPVHFPQLEGQTIEGPFACKWCADDTGEPRLFALARGLRQHESIVHSDEIGSDRLGAQLIQGLGQRLAVGPTAVELDLKGELLKAQEELESLRTAQPGGGFAPAATPYVCGLCGEALPNAFGLNKHISEHKKTPVAA